MPWLNQELYGFHTSPENVKTQPIRLKFNQSNPICHPQSAGCKKNCFPNCLTVARSMRTWGKSTYGTHCLSGVSAPPRALKHDWKIILLPGVYVYMYIYGILHTHVAVYIFHGWWLLGGWVYLTLANNSRGTGRVKNNAKQNKNVAKTCQDPPAHFTFSCCANELAVSSKNSTLC